MANSLEKEYKKLLAKNADIKNELASLPDGYISASAPADHRGYSP